MNLETLDALELYYNRISELNGGANVHKKFNVDPTAQQTLEQKVQESDAFLGMINITGVDELTGEKLGMDIGGPVSSRTDTSAGARRQPVDLTSLSQTDYLLKQTNFDTFLRYDKLDKWAKFPNFQTMVSGLTIIRCALDRMMTGFNGVSAAATTDRAANPLCQDVNKGWLQLMREDNEDRVISEIVGGSGKISIGQGGDYANLDALIMDMKHSLLPSWARLRGDIVAITGADLLHDKYFRKVNKDQDPTEEVALQTILASKRLGGMNAVVPPFFPEDAILCTPLKNLSLYYQNGKRRRLIKDEPEYDRVTDYQSSNEGYVIEDYEQCFLLENIDMLDPEGE